MSCHSVTLLMDWLARVHVTEFWPWTPSCTRSCLTTETHPHLIRSQHLCGHWPDAVIIILPGKCNRFWTGLRLWTELPVLPRYSPFSPSRPRDICEMSVTWYPSWTLNLQGFSILDLTSDFCWPLPPPLTPFLGLPYSLLSQHTGLFMAPQLCQVSYPRAFALAVPVTQNPLLMALHVTGSFLSLRS